MPIIGDHPETGFRFVLERPLRGGPPWEYRGHVFTPRESFALEVTVSADGAVGVVLGSDGPAGVTEKVRLLFRSLYRQAREVPGGEPPRKVVRWRGEK
jgi:hypothetical protein